MLICFLVIAGLGLFGCSWLEAHAVDCADEALWQRKRQRLLRDVAVTHAQALGIGPAANGDPIDWSMLVAKSEREVAQARMLCGLPPEHIKPPENLS